ncbi:MAG: hypothetical protein ACR2KY_02465 [Thermoleophilaceae bacterium]
MSQQREPQTGQQEPTTGRSIEVKTLVIAAAAAVAAAVITSAFWQRGALISTALTPVIVALVQEILRRPAERVSATASRVAAAPVRGAGVLAGVGGRRGPDPTRFEPGRPTAGETPEPTAPARGGSNGAGGNGSVPPPTRFPGDAPTRGTTLATEPPAPKVYGRRRFRWKVVLATGIAAFVVAVGVLTISELALGGSVAGDGGSTLFSGGGSGGADGASGDDSSSDSSQSDSEESAAPSDSSDSQAVPDEDADAADPAPSEEPPPTEEPPTEEPVPPEEPAPSE